jgi:lipopolysaccharide export system protein LptA
MNVQRPAPHFQRPTWRHADGWLGALFILLSIVTGLAQTNRPGAIKGYTVTQYHPAPNFKQLQMKLTGTEAVPLDGPGQRYQVTRPHFQSFQTNGALQVTIETPQCIYDGSDAKARTVSSADKLSMRSGQGDFSIEGKGFLWRQNEKILVISNDVRALVQYTNNAPPLEITSRWFEFDAERRRGVFHDNVRGADTNQVFTCAILSISAATNKAAPGTIAALSTNRTSLDFIEADGGLEITGISKPGSAKAQRGIFRQNEQRVDLLGAAEWDFEGRSGQAERMTIWRKGEDVEATGGVRFTFPARELSVVGNLLDNTNTVARTPTTNRVTVNADRLTKRGDRLLADGNVRVTDGTNQLTCAKLEGKQGTPKSPEEYAIATGGVFVGRTDGGIHSDRADYSKAKDQILFTGNPRFRQGEINGTAGRIMARPSTREVLAEDEVMVTIPIAADSESFLNFLPDARTNRVAIAKHADEKVRVTASNFRLQGQQAVFGGNVKAHQIPADGSEPRLRAAELFVNLTTQRRWESVQARQDVVCERGAVGVTNGPAQYTRMDCESLTALANPTTGDLTQLVADGGVRVIQTGSLARGAKAVYTHGDQVLKLIGSPVIEMPEGTYRSEKELIWDNAGQVVTGSDFTITPNPALLKRAEESEKLSPP